MDERQQRGGSVALRSRSDVSGNLRVAHLDTRTVESVNRGSLPRLAVLCRNAGQRPLADGVRVVVPDSWTAGDGALAQAGVSIRLGRRRLRALLGGDKALQRKPESRPTGYEHGCVAVRRRRRCARAEVARTSGGGP